MSLRNSSRKSTSSVLSSPARPPSALGRKTPFKVSPEVLPVEDHSVDYASFSASMGGAVQVSGENDDEASTPFDLKPQTLSSPNDLSLSKLSLAPSNRQRSATPESPPFGGSFAWNVTGNSSEKRSRSRATSPQVRSRVGSPVPSKFQPQPLVPKISSSYTKGDCIILSSDGVLFRVYREDLWKSAPFLEEVSMGVRVKQGMGNDFPSHVLPVDDKSTTVETLLGWIIVGGKVEERTFEEMANAIRTAKEWGCDMDVIDAMKDTVVAGVKSPLDALNLYILADSLKDSALLSHASRLTLQMSPITTLSALESENHSLSRSNISAKALNALWHLHSVRADRCRTLLSTPLTNIPIGETRPHSNCKNRDALESYWSKTRTILLAQQGAAFDPRDLIRKPGEGSTGITCVACYRCFLHTVELMEQEWREVPSQVQVRY